MVTDADREHFRRIAELERQLNREALERDAQRPPGEKIEEGLALSELAAAGRTELFREPEVAPIQLWRERLARQGG